MGKVTKNMGVDRDELSGFVTLDANEVFVPEGRFRPLNDKKVKEIAESIQKLGMQLQPILVDELGNLIFGNHRLHACIKLGIPVEAKVTSEKNEDRLALMEIDENLLRKELTQTEQENHLAERKKIYNKLFPETAKRGARGEKDGDKESFSKNTAESLGVSEKTVDRIVKRGELATAELQEARDSKVITNSDLDAIIKETGEDKEAQKEALKARIQAKALKKDTPKIVEEVVEEVEVQEVSNKELDEANELIKVLQTRLEEITLELEKSEATTKRLKDRIAKAKTANPDIKI